MSVKQKVIYCLVAQREVSSFVTQLKVYFILVLYHTLIHYMRFVVLYCSMYCD